MASWIMSLLERGGYVAVALLTFAESLFPPIPSELILPLAGYLARRGELALPGAIVAATVGAVLGALPLYFLGRRLGAERVEAWAGRHGHWAAVTPGELRRARDWFERHGWMAVLIGRLVPGVRSLISLPAGIGGMPLLPFAALTAVGSLAWSALLAGAGYLLGGGYASVDRWLDPVSWGVGAFLLGSYAWRVVRRRGAPAEARP